MIGNWPKGFPLRSKVIDYLSPPVRQHGGYYNGFSNKSQEFLAVLSGDYVVVKFVRTYSMYYSTPPCGGQITPCTNPKLRAKMELDWGV